MTEDRRTTVSRGYGAARCDGAGDVTASFVLRLSSFVN